MGDDKAKRRQELAWLILQKARQDLDVVKNFSASDKIADEVIGIHAQQAVEKALKAILTRAGVEFEYTHDEKFIEWAHEIVEK